MTILDAQPEYHKRYRVYNEQNVLKFMIADQENASSITHAILAARENVRTTRDVLPPEVWEQVNELRLYCLEHAEKSCGRRHRHEFLDQVITRCHAIKGVLSSSLCSGEVYSFIKMGTMLERADMNSRIIDVGADALVGQGREQTQVDPLIWSSLLRGLSALAAYRRYVGPLVEPRPVVEFVLDEPSLPRSLRFCFNALREELSQLLNNDEALKHLERARRRLKRFDANTASWDELHQFIDNLQLDINKLSTSITETWFLPLQE